MINHCLLIGLLALGSGLMLLGWHLGTTTVPREPQESDLEPLAPPWGR